MITYASIIPRMNRIVKLATYNVCEIIDFIAGELCLALQDIFIRYINY